MALPNAAASVLPRRAGAEAASAPLVAVEGDIVTLSWKCYNDEGEVGRQLGCQQAAATLLLQHCCAPWASSCCPVSLLQLPCPTYTPPC